MGGLNISPELMDKVVQGASRNCPEPTQNTRGTSAVNGTQFNALQTKSFIKNMPERYKAKTFDGYSAKTEQQQKVVKLLRDFSNNQQGKQGILLYGSTGTGKTHLACALSKIMPYNYETKQAYKVDFIIADEFYQEMNDRVISGNSKLKYVRELVQSSDMIIFDDFTNNNLGNSDAKLENLYLLINRIYIENKTLVMTTNLLPEEINDIDPRIMSRLKEMCHIAKLVGDDYRKTI